MKPTTIKLVIRVLTWLTAIIVIALIGMSVYYFFKPVSPEGPKCTFDNITCESNMNFVYALAGLFYAFIAGLVYGVIRLAIWLLTRPRKRSRIAV